MALILPTVHSFVGGIQTQRFFGQNIDDQPFILRQDFFHIRRRKFMTCQVFVAFLCENNDLRNFYQLAKKSVHINK